MKTAKLSIGIITLVLSLIVLVQSCAAGLGAAMSSNSSDTSGAMGIFIVLLMIVGGILGIAARNSKGGAIATTIVYFIAGLVGIGSSGSFKDLIIWGVLLFAFAIVFGISIFVQKYPSKEKRQIDNNL